MMGTCDLLEFPIKDQRQWHSWGGGLGLGGGLKGGGARAPGAGFLGAPNGPSESSFTLRFLFLTLHEGPKLMYFSSLVS